MTAKTIYLHIGHGKTGSSAIQACLASNHEVLKEHGILILSIPVFVEPEKTALVPVISIREQTSSGSTIN